MCFDVRIKKICIHLSVPNERQTYLIYEIIFHQKCYSLHRIFLTFLEFELVPWLSFFYLGPEIIIIWVLSVNTPSSLSMNICSSSEMKKSPNQSSDEYRHCKECTWNRAIVIDIALDWCISFLTSFHQRWVPARFPITK